MQFKHANNMQTDRRMCTKARILRERIFPVPVGIFDMIKDKIETYGATWRCFAPRCIKCFDRLNDGYIRD